MRLDRTEGTVIIEGKAYPAKEIIEALAQSGYSQIRSSGDALILGRKRIAPIFKSPKERAMASLCHGSLAYCCPLTKRCAERDRALEIIGLSADEYEQMKGESHIRFLDMSERATSHPTSYDWGRPARERVINKPATDRGYGSDDYRRDYDQLESVLDSRYARSTGRPGQRTWEKEPHSGQRGGLHESQRGGSFLTAGLGDGLMQQAIRGRDSGNSCSIRSDAKVEGLGSLFAQGELSPFADESKCETDRLSFCFSCGRTFDPNTKVCPYCGVPQ